MLNRLRSRLAGAAKPMVIDIGLSLVTRVIMIATGILSAIITARALGTAGRGDYVYISTLGLLAVQFANIGLSTANARAAALSPERAGALAGNSLWASLILGLLGAGCVLAYHLVNGNGAAPTLLAVLAVFVPSTLYGVLASNILVGIGQMKTFNLYTLGANMLQLVAIFMAAWLTHDATSVLWANALAVFAGSAWLLGLFRSRSRDAVLYNGALAREGFAFAGRVYIITLLGFTISRANVLMLGAMATKTELGIYSVAMQFGDALMILPATIAMVLFPELVKAQEHGRSIAPMLRAAAWTAALLFPPIVILWALAPWLMTVLFGPDFADSATVLRIILPGTFALGVATIFSQSLSAEGVPISQIVVWLVAGLALLSAGLSLIPKQGAIGAANAFVCSYVVAAMGIIGLVMVRSRSAKRQQET